jgi:hypothetical protein
MRLPFSRSGKSASATDALGPHCANCGSPLAVGQDWCLDCGTAVRGRLGGGPGIGSSMGVVGLTLLLVLGAVAAAYAALSSDSNKAVKAPAAVLAGPTVTATPDIGTTSTAPGVTGTAGPIVTPAITPGTGTTLPALPKIPAVAPPVVATGTPSTVTVKPPVVVTVPKTTVPTSKPTVKTPATTPSATTPTTPAGQTIVLDTDAATTYNPYSLPATSFTDPAKAIDGAPDTGWAYRLDPASAGKTLVGLMIDMKTPQPARAIKIISLSSGMTVEFYGASGSTAPVSIIAPGWVHLANRRAIKPSTTIALKTQGKSFRYLLDWITHAPSGVTAGTIGISELSVSS